MPLPRPTTCPSPRDLATTLTLLGACLLAACGGGDGGGTAPIPDPAEERLYEAAVLLEGAFDAFTASAGNGLGDPRRDAYVALEAAATWLQDRPGVAQTTLADSSYLHIVFDSGLSQVFHLDFRGEDGTSLYRGAGLGEMVAFAASEPCEIEVENGRVLFFTAETTDFGITAYEQTQLRNLFAASEIDFEVTIRRDAECTPALAQTFPEYGLVFIDSHGLPEWTMTGTRVTIEGEVERVGLTSFLDQTRDQLGETDYARLLRGELSFGQKLPVALDDPDWFGGLASFKTGEYRVWLTSEFVRSLGSLSGTILFNGSCYSGWTTPTAEYPDPVGAAYLARSPLAYYGWTRDDGTSKTVDSNLCKEAQGTFIRNLLAEGCTGSAHLQENGTEYRSIPFLDDHWTDLRQYREDGAYYRGPCESEPLVDERDGEVYRTVCVGDKVWMAENLRYAGAGVCYDGEGADCTTEGRLYTAAEATGLATSYDGDTVQGICPQGWHIPTKDEIDALLDAARPWDQQGRNLASTTAWPADLGATDILDISLVPTAMGRIDTIADDEFDEVGQFWVDLERLGEAGRSVIWSSHRHPNAGTPEAFYALHMVAGMVSREFQVVFNVALTSSDDEGQYYQHSCRCVKDGEVPETAAWPEPLKAR